MNRYRESPWLIVGAFLVLMLVLTLTGCADQEPVDSYDYPEPEVASATVSPEPLEHWYYHSNVIELPDGRTVTCVAYAETITCDWMTAK